MTDPIMQKQIGLRLGQISALDTIVDDDDTEFESRSELVRSFVDTGLEGEVP